MSNNFYRCQDCLSIAVVDTSDILKYGTAMSCGACDGNTWYLGRAQGDKLVRLEHKCPCDGRCTGATGPNCDCKCMGQNHGTGRLVTVSITVGSIPRLNINDTEALSRAVEYRTLLADLKTVFITVDKLVRDRVRIDYGAWKSWNNFYSTLADIHSKTTQSTRVKRLEELTATFQAVLNAVPKPVLTVDQLKLAELIETGAVESSNFALDISSKTLFSDKQHAAVKKLILSASAKKPDLGRIKELLLVGKIKGLKHPKITLRPGCRSGCDKQCGDHDRFVVSMASDTSRNPGALYVKQNGEYKGKITVTGSTDIQDADLISFLELAGSDPGSAGRLTSFCIFCDLALSHDNSLNVGYGPICAERYGLPWQAARSINSQIDNALASVNQEDDCLIPTPEDYAHTW